MVAIFSGPLLRCTYANQLFTQLYAGRPIIGKTPPEIAPELEGKGYFEMMHEVCRTGKPFYGYADAATADWNNSGQPSTKYFNFVYSPYQVDENAVGLIAFGLEVTDHVLAQKEAEQRQTFINTISRAAPTGLWVCGPTTDECIFVNETWIKWTGKPLDYHLGTGWGNNLLEEDREGAYQAFLHCYETKEPYRYEYRIQSADGSVKWCLSSGGPWYRADGAFGGFAGSVVDISDRKQEEKRIQSMVEALPLMAWTAKPEGALEYVNKRWYEYTGQTPQEALGSGWASTLPPDTKETVLTKWQYSLRDKVPYEVECQYRRHDGEYRWHIARAEPIKDEAGQVLYWLGTSTDIHEQKCLTDQLERKVQERTHDLISANLALLRSNEELEQFAYVASHDLQEPLRKIQSFGDLLKTQHAEALGEGIGYLERMQSAAGRMSTLIKDLLDYSRISALQDATASIALGAVVQAVLSDLEIRIRETGAQVVLEPLPTVPGDGSQLGHLFQNLLSNALKFRRPQIPLLIRVSCQRLPAGALPPSVRPRRAASSYYHIEVADNGIGFEQKYVDRIFQIFQRLHGKSEYAGTGIGLAICAKVAANHGGAITARSQPGQGATFTLYLPA
ncbi:hypothetical protein GCM10028774_66250 [Spirosoma jeollabukense]